MSEKQSSVGMMVLSALPALNPLLLLVVGYFLNLGIQENKNEIERNTAQLANLKTDAEIASLKLQQRVEKVKVISGFFADLAGADERRRKLAIQAILIALPEEAPKVVMVIESFERETGSAPSKGAIVARDALGGVRATLIEDMYSDVKSIRLEALFTALRLGWSDDPFSLLLNKATAVLQEQTSTRKDKRASGDDSTPGLYNTVAFFSTARIPADPDLKSRVKKLLIAISEGGRRHKIVSSFNC